MSANIKASVDGTQAIIGVGGVDQMTVSNAGVVTANSFVGAISNTNVTATGSTTARTLANRFADVVSVLDFGAVGDGDTDDTDAFQDALNTGKSVYVTSGNYLINNMITVQNGQLLFGDSPTKSILQIKVATVNMSALGIVKLGTGTILSQQEPAGRIENIGFDTNIDTTISSRGSIPNLPPMIYADSAPRGYINNIRIFRAWDGIKILNNSGGFFIGRVEIGALNIGIDIPGECLDFVQGDNWHFWPFGIAGTPLYTSVWNDGQTIACNLGRIDGLNIGKISTFNAKVLITGPVDNIGSNIGILQLDGSFARLVVSGKQIQIGECYSTSGLDSTDPFIEQSQGRLFIDNLWYIGTGNSDQITITNGYLQINGGFLNYVNPANSLLNISNGIANLNNVRLEIPTPARTSPYIKQTGGGLQLIKCTSPNTGLEIVNCSSDNPNNIIEGDYLMPNIINLPSTIHNGKYQAQSSFTATIKPATLGDWAVVYDNREGRMRLDKDWFDFWLRIKFTPTFTTASGLLSISGLPYQVNNINEMGINFFEGITFATNRTSISARFLTTSKTIELYESGSATILDTTNLTSGNQVTLLFVGRGQI
jgi:hypothetical protein